MDTSFSCPQCGLHITADESVVGEEIDCPDCGAKFRVPPPAKPKPKPAPVGEPPKPAAHEAEHKPLVVPHHSGPAESLVKKATPAEAKPEPPKIRVKTIKRSACVEVGHDTFDEKVTEFLNKVGQENLISVSPISYGAMDATGHMLPDYGIMIIYKG